MRKAKYSLDWLATTRQHAIRMWRRALGEKDKEEVEAWEVIIDDLECEMADIVDPTDDKRRSLGRIRTRILCLVVLVNILVLITIVCSSCNLAREGLYGGARCLGAAGQDIEWIGTKLAENIKTEKENPR